MTDGDDVTKAPVTAMDLVRRARDGEISGDDLVAVLSTWRFEPQHRTRGLTDDWESRPNSFDAVEYAFHLGLLDEDAYRRIADRAGGSEAGRE